MQTAQRILYFQTHEKPIAPLGEACLSLTPKVYIPTSPNDGQAYLDIACTERLFGKEENLLSAAEDLKTSFHMEDTWTVVTDKPEWARAFALNPYVVIPRGESQNYLWQLPIERVAYCGDPTQAEDSLKTQTDLAAFMRRVGMTRVADFARLNPTAVGRRFGKQGIQLQQWVLGERYIRLPEWLPLEIIRERLLTEDIYSIDTLLFYLREILIKTEARLKGRSVLAKQIKITFNLESGNRITKVINFSEPIQEAYLISKFVTEVLTHMEWDSPLQELEIEVSDTLPYTPGQLSLWDNAENRLSDLAHYIKRWQKRFGESSVGFPRIENSFLPEKAWSKVWPPPKTVPKITFATNRPPFIYDPPLPIHPPKNARMTPSESISTEWWEIGSAYRKYFVLYQGTERLWVYWDVQTQQWFLQGSFTA